MPQRLTNCLAGREGPLKACGHCGLIKSTPLRFRLPSFSGTTPQIYNRRGCPPAADRADGVGDQRRRKVTNTGRRLDERKELQDQRVSGIVVHFVHFV